MIRGCVSRDRGTRRGSSSDGSSIISSIISSSMIALPTLTTYNRGVRAAASANLRPYPVAAILNTYREGCDGVMVDVVR